MEAVEIIAHRGSSFLAPENTRAAFELAWQEGANAVEGDFRLTADRHIVAMHDDTLMRTAGVDRRVVQCSLDELRSYDVGSWKGKQFADQRAPTLKELLASVPKAHRFFVEVKCGIEIVEPLCRLLSTCDISSKQIVLICLNPGVVQHLKEVIPQCAAYWVVDFKKAPSGRWSPSSDEMLRLAEKIKADGLDLMAGGPLDASLVRRAKSAGLRLCTWTVDDVVLARQLIDLGIPGITTNRPGWLREQLRLPSGTP